MKSPKTVQILDFMVNLTSFSHKTRLFWFPIVQIGKISLIYMFNPLIILIYFSNKFKAQKAISPAYDAP